LLIFSSSRPPVGVTSPTVTMPYSGPVTLLKALNYHNRTSMKGLSVETSIEPAEQSNSRVQRLAQAYSTETFSPINADHVYKLTSAVTHLGGVFSGHFVTYRRVPTQNGQRFPNTWLYTSDTVVKRSSLTEVLGTNAYLLFYEKIWIFQFVSIMFKRILVVYLSSMICDVCHFTTQPDHFSVVFWIVMKTLHAL